MVKGRSGKYIVLCKTLPLEPDIANTLFRVGYCTHLRARNSLHSLKPDIAYTLIRAGYCKHSF